MPNINPASYPDWVIPGPQRPDTVRVRTGRVFLPSLTPSPDMLKTKIYSKNMNKILAWGRKHVPDNRSANQLNGKIFRSEPVNRPHAIPNLF